MTGIAAPITTALPIFHNGEDCSSCRKRNVNQIAINEIAIANTTRALHSAADLIDTPNPMVRGWAWSQFVRPSSTKSSASSIHGDAADLRLICRTPRELDYDLSRRVSRRLELLLNSLVLRTSHGNDIEVRQHLRAINQYVKLSLGRLAPVDLVKVQSDGMRGSGRETANRIGAWRPALALENRLRRDGTG